MSRMTKSVALKNLDEHFTGKMCCQKEWVYIRSFIKGSDRTVRAKRFVQQRKAKIVRCCNTCGSKSICQSTYGCGSPSYKLWQRPTSAVA